MSVKKFLEYMEGSDGLHTFGNCLVRFKKTLIHPKYSVFNYKTREVTFYETLEELLEHKVGGKKIKWHINKFNIAVLYDFSGKRISRTNYFSI